MIINTHSVILKKWNVSFNFIEEMCRIVFLSEIQKKNEHMLAWDYSLKTKLEVGETDLNTYLYVKDFFTLHLKETTVYSYLVISS